jgi:hypothetical protein
MELRRKRKPNRRLLKEIDEQALKELRDRKCLYHIKEKVQDLGVVGEDGNILALALTCMTRQTPEPASAILQSPPGSGKTTVMGRVTDLFPPDCVIQRAGLSKRALAFGKTSLKNKVLVLNEYKSGKDAQLFIRLTQSGETVKHEYTKITGRRHKTEVVERVGVPVVLTTTTDEHIFPDDASRFLRLKVDDSRQQNLAICLARARAPRTKDTSDLPIWQAAMSKIKFKPGDFQRPPKFLTYVARHLPLNNVQVRREWNRILSLMSAAALLRGFESTEAVEIKFADYCVVYRILEPILVVNLKHSDAPEYELAKAAATLNKNLNRPATVREIAEELNWKERFVYKQLKAALRRKLVRTEKGTGEKNRKLVVARKRECNRFLPSPRSVLKHNPELGTKVKYVDPFTGRWKTVKR